MGLVGDVITSRVSRCGRKNLCNKGLFALFEYHTDVNIAYGCHVIKWHRVNVSHSLNGP